MVTLISDMYYEENCDWEKGEGKKYFRSGSKGRLL